MNKRKIMSSVVKSSGGVTYTPSLVTLESGEDIKSVSLTDTDILSGQSIQQILNSGAADTLWQGGSGTNSINRVVEGDTSTVTGDRAVNMGIDNTVSGEGAVAIGSNNGIAAKDSITSGYQLQTLENANFSANFGAQNSNSGQSSLVFGNNNINRGVSSIVGGGYGLVTGKNCLSMTRGSYQIGLRFEKIEELKYKISNLESSIDIYNIKVYLSDNSESIIRCRIGQSDDSLCDAVLQKKGEDYVLNVVGDNFIEPTPQDNIYKFNLFFNYTSGNTTVSIGNVISNSSDGSICTNKAVCNGDYSICFGQSTMTGGENSMIIGDFSISSGNSNVIFGGAHIYSNSTFAFGINGYNSVLYLIGGQKNTKTYTVKIQSNVLFNLTHDIDKILVPGVILRCLSNNEFITAKIVNTEIINKGTENEDIQITTNVSLNPNSDMSGKQIKVSLGMITQPNLGSNDLFPKMLIGQFVAALSKDGPQIVNGFASTSNGSSQLVSGYGLYSGDTEGESAFGVLNYPTVGSGKTSADASLFTIGCGLQNNSSDPDTYNRNVLRRNALEVKRNGDVYVFGVGEYDGKRYNGAQTLQEILAQNANDIIQIKEQIGQSTSDNLWYRTEVTETDEDYTQWTNGDSYSIVNSKTNQPYNQDVTGCRNIVGGYRNKILGDDSLVIGHDNISEGNQNLVLGCNSVANSSSSIVLNDAGWTIKVKYYDQNGQARGPRYRIVELDSDGLLSSLLLSTSSIKIKLRNIPVIGYVSETYLSFNKNDENVVIAKYGNDPETTVNVDFSICRSDQSCSISLGGIADNERTGYYSLAMNGGRTDGMGAIATGYGAYSNAYSLALGSKANASYGSIALSRSRADNESITIPSASSGLYKGTFSNDYTKLILSNFSDYDFDALKQGSLYTVGCFIDINNICAGYGVIHKEASDESYYIDTSDLIFEKQPAVDSSYNVTITISSNASGGSMSIGGNVAQNNSLCVGQMNSTDSMYQNCALFGNHNTVQNDSETAVGSWNRSSKNTKFTVGIGTGSTDRKNAFEVTSDGSVYINGVGDYVGNNASSTNSVKAIIDGKQDTLVSGTSIKTINGQSILGSGDITISEGGTSAGKDVYIFETNSSIGSPLPSYQFTYEDMTNISTAMNSGDYSQMYIKFMDGNLCAVTYYDDNAVTATSGTITMCIQTEHKPVVIKIVNISGAPRTTYSIQTTDVFFGGSDIITISPNVFYNFGQKDSLTVSLGTAPDTTSYNEYMFQFESGDTPTSFTVGAGSGEIKWIGDHTVEANKTYQVSIVNNLAVMGGA